MKIMKPRYRTFKRGNGLWYAHDNHTGKQESRKRHTGHLLTEQWWKSRKCETYSTTTFMMRAAAAMCGEI